MAGRARWESAVEGSVVMVKKKPGRFRASKAVKAAARDLIGSPAPTRAVPVKTKNPVQKHRPTLSKLLHSEE
jgi:hypothetical protein